MYWSETQIKKCEDEGMNFKTGTSWVTISLDAYLFTGVRLTSSAWREERPGNGESLGTED